MLSSPEQFLRLANHELRSPLTAVRVQSQLGGRYLQRGDTQRVAESLRLIEEQSFMMERMLKDLHDVARMRQGRFTIQPVRTNLVNLCRQCVSVRQMSTGRAFTTCFPDTAVLIESDPDALQRALNHLLLNAVLYSPVESEIAVNVQQTNRKQHLSHAIISIRDEGTGIASDELGAIFDQFYRGNASRESETSGLGLGLALSLEIVRLHGGDLWVTSQRPGGSTFFVMLPIADLSAP